MTERRDYTYGSAGDCTITFTQASPEGVVTAPTGSIHLDLAAYAIYLKVSGEGNTGWVLAASGGGALPDGDYGDVTISGGGTIITVNDGVITLDKLQDIPSGYVLGRTSPGTGDVELIPIDDLGGCPCCPEGSEDVITMATGRVIGGAAYTGADPDNSIGGGAFGSFTPSVLSTGDDIDALYAYAADTGIPDAQTVIVLHLSNGGAAASETAFTQFTFTDASSVARTFTREGSDVPTGYDAGTFREWSWTIPSAFVFDDASSYDITFLSCPPVVTVVPGGSPPELQFNDAGAFGGTSGVTYDAEWLYARGGYAATDPSDQDRAELWGGTQPYFSMMGDALVAMDIQTFGAGLFDCSILALYKGRGTFNAKANVAVTDLIGSISMQPWNNSAYRAGSIINTQVQTVNASEVKTKLNFFTSNGTLTDAVLRMVIDGDGGITVGTPTGGSQGAGTLNVDTGLYIDGVPVSAGAAVPGGSDTQLQYNDGGAFNGDAAMVFDDTKKRAKFGNNTVTENNPALSVIQTWNVSSKSVSTLTSVTTTATATCTAHGFSTGDSVVIAGAAPAAYNGTYIITVVDANTFTYTFAGGTSPATGTKTATPVNAAFVVNVTNTASNAASKLIDVQLAGVSKVYVTTLGALVVAPVAAGNADALLGGWNFVSGGAIDSRLISYASGGGISIGGAYWMAGGANVWEMRNTTTAQTVLVYNTWTNSSNSFERAKLKWSSNVFQFGTEKGATTGTARAMDIQTDGTTRATWGATGGLSFAASNTLTFGSFTVSGLGAAGTVGRTAYVTDGAASLANGATVSGGGSTKYLVWDNGTNWIIIGGGVTPTGTTAGRHAIWISAGAMLPSASGGCQPLSNIVSAASQPDITTLNFDPTTQEYAQFSIRMNKAWNEGTITFVPVWSHPATTTNFGVVWDLQAVGVSDDDTIAVAYGTAQTSTDTGGTTNDAYIGPESAAITVGGSPAAEDVVFFRVSRVTGNGSDTMAVDARLHGITVYITTDAETDA